MAATNVYRPRVVDAELAARLGAVGAVVIEGPRACGKTVTARRMAASEVLLDVDDLALAAAQISPGLVLDGAPPRLIDEWQLAPKLWNHVRRAVDDRGATGQFILTGSAAPTDDLTRHGGAGRFSRLQMRPMSLFEAGSSSGAISLGGLLDQQPAASPDTGLSVPAVADLIVRGGWPAWQSIPLDHARRGIRDYLNEITRVDLPRVEGSRRDPQRIQRLLRSLARNVATPAAASTLAADTDGADGPLKPHTVSDYLNALTRVFVVEDQEAWAPHLRSRSVLRQAPKRHFVDPSLACAALNAAPDALLRDLNLLGLLFESMVVRDLRIYAQAAGGRVLHYRDSEGLEVDAIVDCADGRWAAFEIKLGGDTLIDEAAASLTRFARRVDTAKTGSPACLGIIVAGGYGFTRRDGIAVIPIGALGP